MKSIKEVSMYIIIFSIVALSLIVLLFVVAKIPRKYVQPNLKQASGFFLENKREVLKVNLNKKYTWLHPYADQIILNIIYGIDEENVLKSVLEAKYYTANRYMGNNEYYVDMIENNLEPNTEYVRYWHGSICFVKPLLILFTLEQIYIFNAVILSLLALLLCFILIKNKYYELVVALAIGFILTASHVVPFCLEYVWTYYIMLVTSIMAVIVEVKNKPTKNNRLCAIFLVAGTVTCFLDFLTTEILTVLVPLVLVQTIRFRRKETISLKTELLFLTKVLMLWGLCYVFMWLLKWALAVIVLKVDFKTIIFDRAIDRVNGNVMNYSHLQLIMQAIKQNIVSLCIYRKYNVLKVLLISLLISFILFWDRKNKLKNNYLITILILAIIPYIRYAALANHSYRHSFFTFRSQLPTIMFIVLIFINCTNKNKMFSKVNLKPKNRKSFVLKKGSKL